MNGIEKVFQHGDVVYWHRQKGYRHYVEFGIVDERYPGVYTVDLLDCKENRIINGIPYNEFPYITDWKKLPKGWTYNTPLFEQDWEMSDCPFDVRLEDPESIKKAYYAGYLVRLSTKDKSQIETEISKEGYRLVKRIPVGKNTSSSMTVNAHCLYSTFEEAKADVDAYEAEIKRQAELSDYDWSVEQIDKALDRWAYLNSVADDTKQKYRDFILSLKNVEDVVVRTLGESVQWKYDRNKKWNTIEIIA